MFIFIYNTLVLDVKRIDFEKFGWSIPSDPRRAHTFLFFFTYYLFTISSVSIYFPCPLFPLPICYISECNVQYIFKLEGVCQSIFNSFFWRIHICTCGRCLCCISVNIRATSKVAQVNKICNLANFINQCSFQSDLLYFLIYMSIGAKIIPKTK